MRFYSVAIALLVIGCAQAKRPKGMDYQTQSRQILEQVSRGVSAGFSVQGSKARGFSNTVVFGDNHLFGGQVIQPNLNQDAEQCIRGVQSIPARSENYVAMVATLSRCLNRLLVDGNPVMSHGYRNLDSQAQNYYTYLLNWRRFGTFETFPQGDFQTLSRFAGDGFFR